MTALFFEGTLTLDGLAIPARLSFDVDRSQLAGLLQVLLAGPVATAGVPKAGLPAGRITLADITQASTNRRKRELLKARFPWLFDEDEETKPPAIAASSELEDWDIIEAHLVELVTDEGRPVRGYQSRIAELLGGSNAGHFRETRVKPAAARLKQWIESEFILSSSTSPDDEGENDETDDSTRVA